MKELEKIFCVLAFVLLLCVGNLSAQYAKIVDSKKYSKSEMSLFSASIAYFESADYANAYMGFSQLHSWYASDPVFSYYCGASMVMLRNEYDKAIKYLSLAYDNNLYEADYYIGLAYHRKYLFSKSITYYSRYRDYLVKATKGRSPKIAEVEMLMEKANKARALGQESFALKVLTNSKVKRSNFHFSYGRKILDGNLVVKPDFFRQRNDKNNRDIDLVYVLDTIAFVSSYGNDMKTGLDLYVSRKTDEGWSPLQLLPGMVNTDYDEAFPFLSSDGVLYFASKGHNSIGGYDIFKSEYDAGLGLWGKPENLGFPINTPYDDFMYAIESNGKSAFFASDRSSKDGQVMVCRYVLEPDVEKIMIKTEEDLAEHAELPVTPGAEAEYERISREQPAEPEAKDSTPDKVEPQRELDTTDLFVSTRTMLDEKISAISNYDEYSQKLDAYARITSNKIRKAKISGSGMSSSEIAQMANSVVIFYDLSRKFNSVYATAKPTLERCAKDMESLGKMEPGSGEYQFRLHNINVSVGKVNAKSPLAVMIAEKKNERKQADDALKKLSRNMVKDRKNLREINEKLESVMQLIQKETDPKLRERYVNEHKTLENSKVDVINEMKNMQVEAKRLNLMIQKTDESIKMLEDIDEIIANIDLNALGDEAEVGSGDILEMKDLVSEEEDKVVTEFEKAVDEDESLYSEVIDYESISSGAENDARLVTDEVLALEGYMSSSTSAVVQKMKATDALYSEKSNLESQFDTTETEPEKTELLNQINATQKQITENVKAIEAELSYRENPSVSKAIEDFNAIKQTKVEGEAWSDLVSTTQNLIEKSNELAEQMSGQKQPSAVSDVKAKLVGRIKADIDNQIVDNVAEMQDFAVSQQNKREVADMSREVTKIRSSAKDKSFEADIMKDISSVTKKVEASKRETSGTGSNLAEAENILDGTVVKRIAILNEEYDAESRVYDVLNEKYSATKSSDRLRQQADVIYYSALEDKQQADAEMDDVARMRYLSEANKKMKSANSALMQAISPDAKLETQSNDEITESILTLYNDIKAQKGVLSSLAELVDPSRPLSNTNPPTEPVDPSRPLSNTNPPTEPVEVKDNETSIQNSQQNGVVEGSGRPISSQSLQHSVTLQTDLTKRISTNNDDITTIATNMATADRGEKKRLQTFLGEVTAERNGNVRTLGEEKRRFYAELDKAKHDDIAKTSASTDYTNRYADYRQSLYTLTNADPSSADMTEKLAEAEKSEFALLQTIIPNVDTETSIVLVQIYSELDAKYGNTSPAEPVEASASSTAQNDPMSNSQSVIVSNNPSSNPPTEPVDPSRPLSVAEGSGNDISAQNSQHNGVVEWSGRPISSQSLQHSVTLQTDLTKRISTNNDDITTIATNMATANRSEKKRLETYLGEVISERDDNVRTLGEEKQRFYAELDKSKHDDIAKTSASTDYTNRYADYRQSLYTLTNADPSDADMTEKLAEAEKSEYALLQTIIPNVDTETSIVLVQIYSELDAKYGNTSPAEPVEASASSTAQNDPMSNSQSVIVSNNPSSNPPTEPVDPSRPLSVVEGSGRPISSQSLQHSVTLQTDLTKCISTNNDDITTIATNMAIANRSEKKRLETYLGEVISERDDNVRTLGEEKQRFYAELDKAKHDDIAKTSASADYTNRYADYRQSLYTLTNADPSSADMTEKLAEAEKSEYALLQTIIPNVDTETSIVLVQIYSELDAKYGNTSPAEPVEASVSSLAQNDPMSNSQSVRVSNNPSSNPPTEPVDPSRPLSVVEGSGRPISSQSLQHSVTLQTDLTKRISTNNDDITTIATNMATADRGEKKRLQTFLGEVTAERNGNVRTLGEEKRRFYAELDKAKHDDIAKTSASTDYTNRYADYRQSLYSLTNADPSSADMTEKLAEAEKSEYALLQTIIPNVDTETSIVLVQIYSELDAKYGNTSPAEPVEASASSLAQNDPMSNSQSVRVSNNPSSNPPTEPLDPSRPLSVAEGSGNETSIQNAQQNGVVEGSGRPISSQSLQHSVTLQTDLTKRISTNNDDITTIATNMATADRGEKKRLQTFLGEVTAERNGNVRTLGEEKQRFYAELDKAKHDDIAKTSASADYTNRYADYRQSLYTLTNADPSSADMTEKLADAEKSEYALLQTIIPNVDTETSIVLVQIYSELDAKYGNTSPAEPVEASASSLAQNDPMSNSQSVIVSNNPSSNPPTEPVDPSRPLSVVEGSGRPISSQSLQHSVTLQTDLTKRISTNNDDITTIATNMATADRGEKKRLQTFLGEVTAERNGNVRTLGEEKRRFYAELDKSKHDDIAKTSASTDYTNRYADYRQSLYSLTNADLSAADMTEKLADAEKSEYALLQTIIPNVDTETSIVLVQIYSELDAKYGNTSPAEPVEASASSLAQNDPMSNSQSVIVSNNPSSNPPTEPLDPSRPLSVVEGKGNDATAQNSQQNGVAKELDDNSAITTSVDSQQLKASVVRQSEISNRITINASEISAIEGVIAASDGSDKQRLQNELGEITAQRNSNVRSLSEEKQHFYAEIDKSVHDAIAKSDVSSEYKNRYATYRQSLHNLANVEQSGADMSQKLAEAEKAEYALLQTIIPNADSETKSILLPVYNGLEAKYGTTGGVEIAGVVPETYSRSMSLQEQMVRNIEISTKEIERLEQRKEVAKKSEQRRIADDIAREESQKLDDIQKLAVEKSKFYSELNSTLETILPTLSDSARQEYKLAYDSYDETLRTMKIGLGFYDMLVANKIYSDSEIQEYKLLQQMSQVATGESKTVVDNMIGRMEANNSTLKRYKVVVDYVIVENTVNNSSTNSNVAEKRDSVSLNIPDSNSTILASVDSTVVAPKKKSMSGFSADSYGIFEKPEINMGLYYRIQIVAANVKYRMPYFNGLSLIFTEQIPNTNIIRYMTGEYYRYVSAREDLPKVRGLGFSDAFIVAYYNGKRISIGEARRLEALQNVEENEEIPIVIRHEAPADYVEPESIIASSQTKTETISNAENGASFANNSASGQSFTESNSAVYSENVAVNGQIVSSGNVVDSQGGIALDFHEIPSKGVYYAVQIGVYKDRRQPSQMKGVSPIDYETMPNGCIRHTSGRFGNYDQARASQANIRRQGISDAFVIAYIDGRKVSFSEAIEYQKSLESRVIAEANTENTTSKTQGVVSSEENLSNVEYAPLNLNTGTEENNKEGISYYVQIGAFSKSPDPEILSVFSKVAGDKIHVKFPREGLQVYRIGVFNSYEEAQNTLAEARSFGIVDAFIVAFKGEEQISSSEAIRLQNAVRQIEGNSGETINNNVGQKSSQTIQPTSNAEPKPVVPAETLQQASGGVEYFVQLGAFVHTPDTRSMATFRAIATTSGSRLSTVQNGKFTNYRVGAFKKFDDVKAAVENARSMGVTDAFVIAFYNGERIPVVEAKEKE